MEDIDVLYSDATRLVFGFGRPSAQMLQRHLRIGYGQARSLLERMDKEGLINIAKREIISELREKGKED